MAKVKFDNLEYIVLEGGGARGAAYLGAIRALEQLMYKRKQTSSTIKCHSNSEKAALMDYYTIVNGVEVPVIKGIAGSSAGSITAFALALGFNSTEIQTILEYPFTEFLSEKDIGRYRMINGDNKLYVGEDQKHLKKKEMAAHQEFIYDFSADATKVGDNIGKRVLRDFTITSISKILQDGVKINLDQLLNNRLWQATNFKGALAWIGRQRTNFGAGLLSQKIFNSLYSTILSLKVPFKFDSDNLGNLILDRGMFSGFKIREFFLDMVILATAKETHFKRQFVKACPNPEGLEADLKNLGEFKLGERAKSKIKVNVLNLNYFNTIKDLTFKGLYELLQVNLGICVSNFSTGAPMYFGHEWTPDFRVLEAVGGSMSIPPAIKPLFNESNVVTAVEKQLKVVTSKGMKRFIDTKGNFNLSDYYFYEYVVKKALQALIKADQQTRDVYIDLNNEINISTFLPHLRGIVNGKYNRIPGSEVVESLPIDYNIRTEVEINEVTYTVDYELYKFYFNATYKGLFIDGGYRANIPYNFFREKNQSIDTLIAIKLDNEFPEDLMDSVLDAIRPEITIINGLMINIDFLFSETTQTPESIIIDEIMQVAPGVDPKSKAAKKLILEKTRLIYARYFELRAQESEESEEKVSELRKQLKKDNRAITRLAKSVFKHYKKSFARKPWAVPKMILATGFEGYAFGSEDGQIRNISDHNQIIPLYDYGLGVYDFDLSKVAPMSKVAQLNGEQDVLKYFS